MQTMKQAHTHPLPHFSYLRFIRNSPFEVAIYRLFRTHETFYFVNRNKYAVSLVIIDKPNVTNKILILGRRD